MLPFVKFFSNPLWFMRRFKSLGVFRYVRPSRGYKKRIFDFWKKIDKFSLTLQQKIILMEEIFTEAPIRQNHQLKIMESKGIKVFAPYYYRPLVSLAMSLPDNIRAERNFNKSLLYELAEINNVPKEIIEKGKKGLSYGYVNFLKSDFYKKIKEEIKQNEFLKRFVDLSKALDNFSIDRHYFLLFDRLRSFHYFTKIVLNL